ncbi:hypothetical protein SDC9_97849 [bioreactor metagenome]|uniref:Phosphatidylglycerol lysyltransferase C-terminal domain-containing protein n=1 Tax=bioreactor metagenome TaxID=1076179 RepID=A0A645AJR6_9ZZZZ|nr:phosphatidylglycerol lysyltransferase domain-containing protein [Romboutsia lituseburensis]
MFELVEDVVLFKPIDIKAKDILQPYFDLVDYEACEYCFVTLYMWKDLYKTVYYVEDDFAIVSGEYEGSEFVVLPLASKENMGKAIKFIIDTFKGKGKKIHLRAITKEIVDFMKVNYEGMFEYIEERDYFDYVYDGESLRTLAGRKNQKKRNHLNYFLKEYENRFEYKKIESEEQFKECINLVQLWSEGKEDQKDYEDEFNAIQRIFDNYELLKENLRIGGIYIDSKLEAFTIGEMLNNDMAVIHIEKANPDIRGLYPYINQQFLLNEFKNTKFINREEDLGIEGLRKAKLSYHPIKFVEKYTVLEI